MARTHEQYDSILFDNFCWSVNGKKVRSGSIAIDGEAADLQDVTWAGWKVDTCPFCRTRMESTAFRDPSANLSYDEAWSLFRSYAVSQCTNCGYWEFRGSETSNRCMDAPAIVAAVSVARKLDEPMPEGCASELAATIRRDPTWWHRINPTKFEKFVADVFRANYRHSEVLHVGKPGDLGKDVLYIDSGDRCWFVQAKRRTKPHAVEGFETLQRLLGTLVLEDGKFGIVVTTAARFSRQLLRQKVAAEKRGYVIELVDRGQLDRMLSPLLPNRPWLALLKDPMLMGVDSEVRKRFIENTSDPSQPRLF